jgi:hypothetical protein
MGSFAIKGVIAVWLFLFSVLCSPSNGRTEAAKGPAKNNGALIVSKVVGLAELISSDQPSLSDALRITGGRITDTESKKGILVAGDHYKVVVDYTKDKKENSVSEVSIYLDSELGLRFKDLKEILGEWKTIHQSKTSSVLFRYQHSQTGGKAFIYVHMSFPPSDPLSPVFLIIIRRELGSGLHN